MPPTAPLVHRKDEKKPRKMKRRGNWTYRARDTNEVAPAKPQERPPPLFNCYCSHPFKTERSQRRQKLPTIYDEKPVTSTFLQRPQTLRSHMGLHAPERRTPLQLPREGFLVNKYLTAFRAQAFQDGQLVGWSKHVLEVTEAVGQHANWDRPLRINDNGSKPRNSGCAKEQRARLGCRINK